MLKKKPSVLQLDFLSVRVLFFTVDRTVERTRKKKGWDTLAENSFLESMNGREKKGGKKNKQSEKKGKIGDRTAKGSVLARGIGASAGQGERFSFSILFPFGLFLYDTLFSFFPSIFVVAVDTSSVVFFFRALFLCFVFSTDREGADDVTNGRVILAAVFPPTS